MISNNADFCIDITDDQTLKKTIDVLKPDLIINTVAIVSHKICQENPALAYSTNARPVAVLSEIARQKGADNIYIDDKLAPDAGKLLLNYGFNELNLHRIWAEIYNFDESKKKLFKDLGLVLEGEHRETYWHEGKWFNSLFFSTLSSEFNLKKY